MKMNHWKITFIAGLLTVLAFINLSCVSIVSMKSSFSPLVQYFSDFGTKTINPGGAIFLNLAYLLSGVGLFFFFLGLSCWKLEETKERKLGITFFYGFLASLFLFLDGIGFWLKGTNLLFPLASNLFRSINFNFFFGFASLFLGVILLKHPKMEKKLSVYSIVTGLLHLASLFYSPPLLSWITTLSWLLFVTFFSFRTKKVFGY